MIKHRKLYVGVALVMMLCKFADVVTADLTCFAGSSVVNRLIIGAWPSWSQVKCKNVNVKVFLVWSLQTLS